MDTTQIRITYRSEDAKKLLIGLIGLEVLFAASYIFMFAWPGGLDAACRSSTP